MAILESNLMSEALKHGVTRLDSCPEMGRLELCAHPETWGLKPWFKSWSMRLNFRSNEVLCCGGDPDMWRVSKRVPDSWVLLTVSVCSKGGEAVKEAA